MKKVLAWILILCLLPLYAFAGSENGEENTPCYALISSAKLTNRLNLREKPSSDSETLGRFYNGTVVEVMQKGEEWSYVRVGNRLWGYMMNEYLVFFNNRDSFVLGGEMSGQEQGVFRAAVKSGAAVYDSMRTGDVLDRVTGSETMIVLGDINDDWLLVYREYDHRQSVYVRRQDITERCMDGLAVVVSSKPESMITLRAEARDNAAAIGKYRAGTVMAVYDTKNGYAHVAVIGEGRNYSAYDIQEQTGFVQGWMKVDYLRWGNRADWIGTRNDLLIGQVKGREATVYDAAYQPVDVLGKGMRMLVLNTADAGGFLHVDTGSAGAVFIREEDVEILKDVHTAGDLPVMGYGVIRDVLPYEENWGFVDTYEYCNTLSRSEEIWDGAAVTVLSVGDEWVQIRRRGMEGYIPLENVELFLMDEWIGSARAAAGTFHVGTEYFKEGFYTFYGDPGDELTVTDAAGTVRSFGTDGGDYTLYLAAGDAVTLTGGLLAPMERSQYLLTAHADTYSGSGRYLCGEHLRGSGYWDYKIQPLDPSQEAWYEISTLSYEVDGDGHCTRVSLSEEKGVFDSINSLQLIELTEGEILEFHNCILRIHYGNG